MFKKYLSLLFIVSLFSCTEQNKTKPISFAPKVTVAKGYIVPKDSIQEPNTIPLRSLITVKAGPPKVNPTNLNFHMAGEPNVIIAGSPKVNTPGADTFSLPKSVSAIGKTKPAGIPEVTIAKDAAAKDVNPANFSFYKTLQGLKHNTIRCILQDKTGNLWFGTDGGVCRYDGKSFTNFTDKEGLANNVVWSILEDKTGNLWFGTYGGGVSRYDGKSFTNFTDKEGLINNIVWSIFEDKTGSLWFGTNGGVSRYDGKSFTNFTEKEGLANNVVWSMLEDKNGNLWFGTYGGGVSFYDGKSFTNFTDKEGLVNNIVFSIREDKIGNLWFGTNGGVSRYDGNRVEAIERGENIPLQDQQDLKRENGKLVKSFTNITDKEGLANNMVWSILEDKTGNLWFGTNGGGVSRYDGKSFTNFTDKEGLADNVVYSIFEDKTGNLWFGTYGGGVLRYGGKSFTNFTDKEGLANNYVCSILEDKTGNLWFGTNGGGVSRYDEKSFTNFTNKEGLANNVVYSILEDRTGNLWFGTFGGGVSRYDGKSFTNFSNKEGLPNNVVWSILEDKIGNLWFATNGGGVSRYDGNRVEAIERGENIPLSDQKDLKRENGKLIKSFTNFTDKEGLADNVVWRILEDKKGNIWFGTNSGVSRYDGKSFTEFTDKEGLANNVVYSILEDKTGNLWFGTIGGVSCYDGKSFTNYTDKEGLTNNAVLNMMQDVQGNIWFGTRKGLSKVTSAHLTKLSSYTNASEEGVENRESFFYNYGYNDGFLGLTCRRNSVLQDSKGRIWWGTDVLTCYDPKGDIADTMPPIVQLNSIKLFEEDLAWANLGSVITDSTGKEIIKGKSTDTILTNGILLEDIRFDGLTKWYSLPEHLSLPYNNNNLTFKFIGVHMQSRNHIKYQYKLEGMDPDWSSITERTEAPYGNLPSGDYIFKVKAMNQSGVWSEPFEFKFEVRPPWWKTWWFRTLVVLSVMGVIIFYIKWREGKLKQRQKELEVKIDEAVIEIKEQKHEIEEKQKEILDSIRYAKRIQKAHLPTEKYIDSSINKLKKD